MAKDKKSKSAATAPKPQAASKGGAKQTTDGMVVMTAQPDSGAVEMTEASADILESTKKAVKSDIKSKLNRLVGKTVEAAQKELDELIAAGKIGSFRLVKQGQMLSGDFVSDRVQVFTAGSEVKEITIG